MYHGKQRHPDDLSAVISRAKEVGCQKLIVTGSDLTNSKEALDIAKEYRKALPQTMSTKTYAAHIANSLILSIAGVVYTTAGIHPCSSAVFGASHKSPASDESGNDTNNGHGHSTPCDPDPSKPISEEDNACPKKTAEIITSLKNLITSAQSATPNNALVAFGEFGLDYDRLHYCSRKIQLHSFAAQLDLVLAMKQQLPLFLHSRAAHADFVSLLKEKFGPRLEKLERGGVVHSFTGTAEEMRELMDLGLYIGTNGCSFKTAENCDVVKQIKLDRLMLETDGPWCEIRPSHEGWKYLVSKIKADKETAALSMAEADSSEGKQDKDNNQNSEQPVLAAATAALASSSQTPHSSASTPGTSSSPNLASTTNTTTTTTTSSSTRTHTPGPKPQRKKPNPTPKQQQAKKEPDVPERWQAVKKEKWVEGAMVKSRNEPCMIERVAVVVAAIKGVGVDEVCEAAWENTCRVFKLED